MPSCLDVMKSSPSRLRPMCRSARVTVAPFVASMSSLNVTNVRPPASTHVQLDFFDRRDGLWNPVVSLFHRGDVGREKTPALDVAEHELAAELGDAAVIGESIGHRRLPRRGRRSRPDR